MINSKKNLVSRIFFLLIDYTCFIFLFIADTEDVKRQTETLKESKSL